MPDEAGSMGLFYRSDDLVPADGREIVEELYQRLASVEAPDA